MKLSDFIYKHFRGPVKKIWKITAEGLEYIPAEGGCILVCNHTSFSDVLVLQGACEDRQIRFMGKAELFKIPLISSFLKALGAFPVDRRGGDVKAIKQTIAMINGGDMVGIFPQGTRHPFVDPRETEVKAGVAMIAGRAKCGIVPVYIDNPCGRTKAWRNNHAIFGKFIPYEELGFESGGRADYDRVAKYIFSKVCELKYGPAEENSSNEAES